MSTTVELGFEFLDKTRGSNAEILPLSRYLGVSYLTARDIFLEWKRTFSENEIAAERADKARVHL